MKFEDRSPGRKQPGKDKFMDKASAFADKASYYWAYIKKNRKALLALPVAVIAIIMAVINLFALPPLVGFGIQADGEFAFELIREIAVLAPLAITAICLLLMYVSKRMLTPCLVSWMTLILPLMILLTNTFPS